MELVAMRSKVSWQAEVGVLNEAGVSHNHGQQILHIVINYNKLQITHQAFF